MRLWKSSVILLTAAAVGLWGCNASPKSSQGTQTGAKTQETDPGRELSDDGTLADLETADPEAGFSGAQRENPAFSEYVAIKAHIKEINGEEALVSSDTDEFPGVFLVRGLSALTGGDTLDQDSELKGGTPIFLVMADSGQKTEDGIPVCTAAEIYPLSQDPGQEKQARVDVLLTNPPSLTLTDVLSSLYDPFEVLPGNYSWNVDEGNGSITSVIACGSAPLDEEGLRSAAKLQVKNYNRIDNTWYSYSMVFSPDKLTIRQWDMSQVKDADAREERVTTYYCLMPLLLLEKGKVYEFSAEWKQENLEKNGFWGDAAYVFATE